MNDTHMPSASHFTRKRLIQLLNQDLVSEFHAMIAFIVYSQVLKNAAYTATALELERHAAEDYEHAKALADQIAFLGGKPCIKPNLEDMTHLMLSA